MALAVCFVALVAMPPLVAQPANAPTNTLSRLESTPEQKLAARTVLEQAARRGDVEAMVQLANLLLHPPAGGQPEGRNALHWLIKAHDCGRKGICSQIGWVYGGEPLVGWKDEEMAVRWFRLGVREGDAYCELSLGWMLVTGRGVERNAEDGIAWMKKAADKGNPAAQRNLGRVYEQAEPDLWTGQPPDYVHAEKWYRLAADKGDAEAAYRLGRLALEAHIKASRAEAVNWLRTAADQGHLRAATRLKELKETN